MSNTELIAEARDLANASRLIKHGASSHMDTIDDLADALEAADRKRAEAWDEGHKARWRRGPDNCHCEAWSSSECACGQYGNGELLSLGDNPYREQP